MYKTIDLSAYISEFNVNDVLVELETEDLISELCDRALSETESDRILENIDEEYLYSAFYGSFESFLDSCTDEELLHFENCIENKLKETKKSEYIDSVLK